MRENTNQNNPKYGHFSRSDSFDFFGARMVKKVLLIVNNSRIPKILTYHKIHFHSLKITFEKSMKVRTSHSNISVVVNAAEIIALICWLDVYYDLIKSGYIDRELYLLAMVLVARNIHLLNLS